jgi:RHS repeat-associated protein
VLTGLDVRALLRKVLIFWGHTMKHCDVQVTSGVRPVRDISLKNRARRYGSPRDRRLTAICSFVAISLAAFCVGADASDTSTLMAIPGNFGVGSSGGATYSIPIAVPPGTAGMVPSVSLRYSSQGSDGIVGYQWSLQYGTAPSGSAASSSFGKVQATQQIQAAEYLSGGASVDMGAGSGGSNVSVGANAIVRCPRTIAQDGTRSGITHTAADRFCIDGQRLVSTSGTYGADGTVYSTEVEGYTKVISYGISGSGPTYFRVWLKSGQILEFGNTTDSRYLTTTGTGTVRGWALNKVWDRKGNYWTVTYVNDTVNGQIYPSRIDYTGNANASLSPYNSVRFEYNTSRPDVIPLYQAGSLQKTTVLLTNIKTYQGTNLVRNYVVNYRLGSSTTHSRLTSVTLCDRSNNCLAPTTFGWQGTESTLSSATQSMSIQSSWDGGYSFGDLNGDGLTDALQPSAIGYQGTGTASGPLRVWYGAPGSVFPTHTDLTVTLSGIWGMGYGTFNASVTVLDYDGDGIGDIEWTQSERGQFDVCNDDDGYCTVTPHSYHIRHNGLGTLTQVGSLPEGYNSYGYADYDGDGLVDWVQFTPNPLTQLGWFFPHFGSGAGAFDTRQGVTTTTDGQLSFLWRENLGSQTINPYSMVAPIYTIGDKDADGISDIVLLDHTTGSVTRYYAGVGNITIYTNLRSKGLAGDFNGDGATDTITIDSNGQNNNVATLSYGNSGGASITITLPSQPYYSFPQTDGDDEQGRHTSGWAMVGDWNGDGRTDLAIRTTDDSGWNLYLSTGAGFVLSGSVSINSCYLNNCVLADLNNDGVVDLAAPGTDASNYNTIAWLSSYIPELMTSVTNGIGQTITIAYDRLNKNGSFYQKCANGTYVCGDTFPTQGVNGPIYAVKQVSQNNGIGGTFVRSYSYMGLKTHLRGRGNLGFSRVTETDAQTGIVTTTNYETAFPLTGSVKSQTVASGGVTLKSIVNTYSTTTIGTGVEGVTRYKITLTQRVTAANDLNGAALPTVTNSFTYDDYGNVLTDTNAVSDGSSSVVTNTYANDTTNWLLGQILTRTVASTVGSSSATRTQSFAHDPSSGLITQQVIEPNLAALRAQTDFTYDPFGNRLSEAISGSSVATCTVSNAYDSFGRFVLSKTNCLSQTASATYNADYGTPATQTDLNGHTTSWSYDGFGRMTNETRPDGNNIVASYAYCSGVNGGTASCPAYGTFVTASMPTNAGNSQNGANAYVYYDSLGRSIASDTQGFDGNLIRVTTAFNANGWVAQTSRPYFVSSGNARYTVNSYDALGRVTQTTMPDASITTFCYNGLQTAQTNNLGQTTTALKNAQGLAASVVQGTGITSACSPSAAVTTTSYIYDAFGNLQTITDPAGNVTTNTYDVRGNRTASRDPDMGVWSYSYDVFGRLVSQTDAKNQTSTLGYDALGRLTGAVEGSFTRTFTYDSATNGAGLLASTSSSDGTSRTFAYDGYSRPVTSTLTVDGTAYVTATSYNSDGRISTLSYPSGFVARYNYGSYGDLTHIKDHATGSTLWQANGRDAELHLMSQTFGNGVTQTNSFNTNTGLLSNIRAGTNDTVAAFDYTFNTIGSLTYRSDNRTGVFEYFCYDSLNRLVEYAAGNAVTACSSGQNHKTVTYNAIGNILSKSDVGSYAYPASGSNSVRPHAVSVITGTVSGVVNPSYSYDANGNMTSGAGRTVAYTVFNMTASIVQGTTSIALAYDATHNRVKQVEVAGGTTTTTIYVDDLVSGTSAEKISTSSTAYKWNDYFVIPAGMAFDGKASGVRVGVRTTTVSGTGTTKADSYFVLDHLGSTAAIVDSSGAVVQRLAYDPWGKRRNSDGTDDVVGAIRGQTNRGFTSHEHMDDVGLINMNARVYDPAIGRFMAADPITTTPYVAQSLNRYTYVENRPLSLTDPTGMESKGNGCETDLSGSICRYQMDEQPSPITIVLPNPDLNSNGGCRIPDGGCTYSIGFLAEWKSNQAYRAAQKKDEGSNGADGTPHGQVTEIGNGSFVSDGQGASGGRTQLAQEWLGPFIKGFGARAPVVPRIAPRPSVPYPQDPLAPPGPGWEWKGPLGDTPGTGKGQWFNPKTGESLRWDTGRGVEPPHYDYSPARGQGGRGSGWQWFPDGSMSPKSIAPVYDRDGHIIA